MLTNRARPPVAAAFTLRETSRDVAKTEFDEFSQDYDSLLKDPIIDRFTAGGREFFHARKCDLIRDYFRRRQIDTGKLEYLDVGCGRGELTMLLRGDFSRVAGCDPSASMLEVGSKVQSKEIETRKQHGTQLPFNNAQFDFVSAVCVYHHVPLTDRAALTAEVRRVLRPGGVFAIIEHNPYNPITRLIVSRAPVDANAILISPAESRRVLRQSGFKIDAQHFFLYLPEILYRRFGRLESQLIKWPLGGQYAVFGQAIPDNEDWGSPERHKDSHRQ
jgi:SAM-dependent methyltransferase